MGIPPKPEGESEITYVLREYIIPGVIFFFLAKYLIWNVVGPFFYYGMWRGLKFRDSPDSGDVVSDETEEGAPVEKRAAITANASKQD